MNKAAIVTAALVAWLAAGAARAPAQDFDGLDAAEQQAATDTMQHALEYNPTNQASDWVNPDTDRSGTVAPVKTFENAQGQPCREFITTITIGGRQEQGYGTACRQPDGSWQIVPDDQAEAAAPPPPPTKVYVHPPPAEYYAYPGALYGSSRIFLSFSYVYRGGHIHRGRPYLRGPVFWQRYRHPIRERIFVGPRIHRHYDRDWSRREHHDWDDRRNWGHGRGRGDRDEHWSRGDRGGRPDRFDRFDRDDRRDRDDWRDHRGGGHR